MEVQQDDHLSVARLEERVLDVVVQNVDLVPADRGVAEAVGVRLQHARETLLDDVGPDVEVFQLGIALAGAENEGVLLHEIGLLLVLRLASLESLLDVLDQLECSVQV